MAKATKFTDVHITGTLTVDGATVENDQISADTTFATDKKAIFRSAGIFINSPAAGKLDIAADGTGSDDISLSGTVKVTEGLQVGGIALTATADGTGTGTIPAGASFGTVTCDDANKIIVLPAPVVGNVVRLVNGATGYELRSSDPATIKINGGSGAAAESAIPANTLVTCVCTSATTWICMNQASAGTVAATEVAAA